MKLLVLALCLCSVSTLPNVKRKFGERIIGGQRARAGQFPYAAAIFTTTADGNYFCGGALITNLWVLTAGQCVDKVTLFTVHLGTNSLSAADPNAVRVASDVYILHPNYDRSTLNYDVGLVHLRLPVTFSDYLKAIDFLPSNELTASAATLAIGWGQLDDEKEGLSDELHYVQVTTLSNTECSNTYGNQITENMVCVGGNYNEGACNGDSGSPLVQTVNLGYSVIVGVSSFLSGNGCESPDPSGYARIFTSNDWIRNTSGRF